MTNDEAKFILGGYRPGGGDAGDPMFQSALEQARRDPALGAWFAREQAHDATVARKLAEIQAPEGLRNAILTGAQVSSGTNRSRWWAVHPAMAAAAGVVILLAVVGLWKLTRESAVGANLAEAALDDLAHGAHGGHGAVTAGLQGWLSSPDARIASQKLPADFEDLRRTGCRTVILGGREFLEVCFTRGGPEFHLYISRRKGGLNGGKSTSPSLIAKAGAAAATWRDAQFDYALVSTAGLDALKRLL